MDATGATAEPLLTAYVPGAASSWTPSLDACLERGRRYAWSVRAHRDRSPSEWSEPKLFEVHEARTGREIEEALATLRDYLASGGHEPALPTAPPSLPSRSVGSSSGASLTDGGVESMLPAANAVGVQSEVADTTGITIGVRGVSNSTDDFSAGIAGESTATSGSAFGVSGAAASPSGAGVLAFNSATTGSGAGLLARTNASDGAAIDAEAAAETGSALGVLARTNSAAGAGLQAANLNPAGGADLILDGTTHSVTDAGGAETFTIQNSGGGSMAVSVHGALAATTLSGDGAGVSNIDPDNLSAAVAIALGGTGATDAAGARSNLGAAAAADLTSHSTDATAHHVPPTALPPSGAAGVWAARAR